MNIGAGGGGYFYPKKFFPFFYRETLYNRKKGHNKGINDICHHEHLQII